MKVLVACEYSGRVREAFRAKGHEAYSCDLVESDDNSPHHFIGDVVPYLNDDWDMVIAFPPCTHLASSGAKHFAKKIADGRQQEGIEFFMLFTQLDAPLVAIENPIGIMSKRYGKPDQIIQPYYFGDPFQKSTCLWLKGLPELQPTNIVDKGEFYVSPTGKRLPRWYSDNKSAKVRSMTFPGIAQAMADQWG